MPSAPSSSTKPILMIIIASMRQGRAGLPVGKWFEATADSHGAFSIDLVDLVELNLPPMTEPNHPRLQQYTQEHTKAWSARVSAADAFVFVTPEYNHTFTAPLKNALDYLSKEWANKPLGFVTYGGVSGGTRAMTALLPVAFALSMRAVQPAVNIPFFGQYLKEGQFEPNDVTMKAAADMLTRLEGEARRSLQLRQG